MNSNILLTTCWCQFRNNKELASQCNELFLHKCLLHVYFSFSVNAITGIVLYEVDSTVLTVNTAQSPNTQAIIYLNVKTL